MSTTPVASRLLKAVTPSTVRPANIRRLYLVDIENAVGGPRPTAHEVAAVRTELAAAYPTHAGDLVIVGVAHNGLLEVGCTWTGVRHVTRSGEDGADLALLEELDDSVLRRFDEVVIVSGDHLFSERIAELAALGLPTTVIAREESLSTRLRLAATNVVYLENERRRGPGAAAMEVA